MKFSKEFPTAESILKDINEENLKRMAGFSKNKKKKTPTELPKKQHKEFPK